MSTISSSAYYNVSSTSNSSNGGISGLMSGFDTEALVEDMLAGTQAKIDVQNGLLQQSEWKQEIYRDLITDINEFGNKYLDSSFGASSTNNLTNSDFFNNMTSSVIGGNALSILSSSSDAYAGDMSVIVKQLATAASLKSTQKLSTNGTITGESTNAGKEIFSDEYIDANYNKNVKLSINDGADITVDLNGATNSEEVINRFENALGEGYTVELENNVLKITSDDASDTIEVTGGSKRGLAVTGLSVSGENPSETIQAGHALDFTSGVTFDLSYDGVTKSINLTDIKDLDGDGTITAKEFESTLQQKVSTAFGSYITVDIVGVGAEGEADAPDNERYLSLGIATSEDGHDIKVTGLGAYELGMTPGDSTQFNTSLKLSEVGTGSSFAFTINGVDFEFDGTESVSKMMNEINSSDAGVMLTYSTLTDTMQLVSSSTGSNYGINIEQTQGDILTKLFGEGTISQSSSISSATLTKKSIESDGFSNASIKQGSITFEVNGASHTYSFSEEDGKSGADIVTDMNEWLESRFGTDDSGVANVSFDLNDTKTGGTLNTAKGYEVEVKESGVTGENVDLGITFGLANKNNAVTTSTALSELAGFSDTATGTVADLLASSDPNITATFENGKINLNSATSGAVDLSSINASFAELFENTSVTFGDGTAVAGVITAGQDALIEVNGVSTSRSSNTFTIDGITMKATQVSETNSAGDYVNTTITTSRNDDAIVETVKEFIDDYNELVKTLNDVIREDDNYKDYAPLSSAQKAEMSDREIELWEEKAKEGLLRNDSAISSLLSSMRSIMYSLPEGASVAMYQIGIETTSEYNDGGQLQFDETAFRNALASDPSGVSALFSSENGIAKQLEDAIDDAANLSSADPGSLVSEAGYVGYSTEGSNALTTEMDSIKDRIEELQHRYELEKDRYWAQFTTMESVLSNYNTQSQYLMSQFGY